MSKLVVVCAGLASLNESPSEKEGKFIDFLSGASLHKALNESPSEKEGKCQTRTDQKSCCADPSMKVPPKRKGNGAAINDGRLVGPSMKVPPKRKGNTFDVPGHVLLRALNESPSEKEGKSSTPAALASSSFFPSMKVPPKRKGNFNACSMGGVAAHTPSMKVPPKRKGNQNVVMTRRGRNGPSMKVPPKRKGNKP